MPPDRFAPTRPGLALLAILAATGVAAAGNGRPDDWSGPLHGLAVAVPGGWTSKVEAGESARRITLTCETQACRETMETCAVIVADTPIPRMGVPFPGAWLVKLTLGSDTEAGVLERAREGSRITAGPGTVWIGRQSWYATETIAPHGWKSLYEATTVVSGRFVKARCWTCDRTEGRFDFARNVLSKVRLAR